MGMTESQLDRLDEIADSVRQGDTDRVGVLSVGEQVYVGLAANSVEVLTQTGYTIAQAISRLGDDDTRALVARWRYKG